MNFSYFKHFNNISNENTDHLSYLILTEETKKISDFCNSRCIVSYGSEELDSSEINCLKECSTKLSSLSSFNLSLIRNSL